MLLKRVVRAIELISAANVLFMVIVQKWKNIISQITLMIRGPFSMPWWTASCSGRWIRGGRHIQSLNLFAVHFNRILVLASGRRQRVSHLRHNVLWFGQAEGNWTQQGVFCLGSPRCSFPTSASWSDSGPRLKLVVLVWAIFVNRHCGQGVSFGVALPPSVPCLWTQQVQWGNLSFVEWQTAERAALGSMLRGVFTPEGFFPPFFSLGQNWRQLPGSGADRKTRSWVA